MSVTLGDAFNRGRLDAFVTNISERGYLFQNNNLRLNQLRESRRFRNVAEGAVADAGWAWGAQFGDLNNDGSNELFVANGFISADRNQSYWYAMSKIAGANARFFEDASTWPAFGNASLSGYEPSRVYLNRGVAGWIDVAETVGVTDLYDGRAVALADLFESRRGRRDRREPEPAGAPLSQPARQRQPLDRLQARRHAQQPQRDRRRGDARVGRARAAARRRRRDRDSRARTTGACTSGSARASGWTASSIDWPSGARQVLTRPPIDRVVTVTEPASMSDATARRELAAAGGERARATLGARRTDRSALSHRVPHHARAAGRRSSATTCSAATTRLVLALGVCIGDGGAASRGSTAAASSTC